MSAIHTPQTHKKFLPRPDKDLVSNGNTRGTKENGFICFRQLSFDADGKLMPVEYAMHNGPFALRCTKQHKGRFIVRLEWPENAYNEAKLFVIDTEDDSKRDMTDNAARSLVKAVTHDSEIDNFLQPGRGLSYVPLSLIPEAEYKSTVRKKERYQRFTTWLGLSLSWQEFAMSPADMLQTVVVAMPEGFNPNAHTPVKIVRVIDGKQEVVSCETWYGGRNGGSVPLTVDWRVENTQGEMLSPGSPGLQGWEKHRFIVMIRTGANLFENEYCGLEIRTFDTDPEGLQKAMERKERARTGAPAPRPSAPPVDLISKRPRTFLQTLNDAPQYRPLKPIATVQLPAAVHEEPMDEIEAGYKADREAMEAAGLVAPINPPAPPAIPMTTLGGVFGEQLEQAVAENEDENEAPVAEEPTHEERVEADEAPTDTEG